MVGSVAWLPCIYIMKGLCLCAVSQALPQKGGPVVVIVVDV